MFKNILVISTSPRKGGNSETLANEFVRGAKETGHTVEKICLYDKEIGFCKGCLSCNKTHQCFILDDANSIVKKMRVADVLVFATPIYYYEMCGQMKTILDRANPLFGSDYSFRSIYMLSTAADDEEDVPQRAQNGLQGWIDCFPKAHLVGSVFAGGVDAVGQIKGHSALKTAYELGKAIASEEE